MADFTEVANALVSVIAGIVYPSGTSSPSITGDPVVVYQGWPVADLLDADLSAGKMHVSVFPTAMEREMPMRAQDWTSLSVDAPTVAMVLAGVTVSVSGTGTAGHNAALLVDGLPYVYPIQTNDTATAIATALANLVNAARPASNAGAVITIPDARHIVARVGSKGTSIRELRRQEKVFQVSIWANCFDERDPLASKIDAALAAVSRISLPDGTQGVLRYRNSVQDDNTQKNGIYRRDIFFGVEYAVTETAVGTEIVIEEMTVAPDLLGTQNGQITVYS